MGTNTMSSFFCLTAEQKQLFHFHVIVVLTVLESRSAVLTDVPFNSSKTKSRISATSCWELKSKGALRVDEILHLSAHRKFDGSIAIFSAVDFRNGDSCADIKYQVH